MMFKSKDQTCSGGESLCTTCRFRNKNTVNCYCDHDKEFYKNVGVCKDYEPEQ